MPNRTAGVPNARRCSCSSMASTRRSTTARSRSESRRSLIAEERPVVLGPGRARLGPADDRGRRAGRPIRASTSSTGSSRAPATRSRTSALGLGSRRMAPMASLRPGLEVPPQGSRRPWPGGPRRDAAARAARAARRASARTRPTAAIRPRRQRAGSRRRESSRSARRVPCRARTRSRPHTAGPLALGPEAVAGRQRRARSRRGGGWTGPAPRARASSSPQSAPMSGSSQATPSSSLGL